MLSTIDSAEAASSSTILSPELRVCALSLPLAAAKTRPTARTTNQFARSPGEMIIIKSGGQSPLSLLLLRGRSSLLLSKARATKRALERSAGAEMPPKLVQIFARFPKFARAPQRQLPSEASGERALRVQQVNTGAALFASSVGGSRAKEKDELHTWSLSARALSRFVLHIVQAERVQQARKRPNWGPLEGGPKVGASDD